ncbi:MAG TPA: hypothetical protein VGR93_10680 [Candidatus Acidoferrales bacterium]|nr:hypothetical protein [Candidatus Acidoferrales bacterium]
MKPIHTLLAIFGALIFAVPAFAQGSRHDGVALGEQGRPVAGASIVVCSQPANVTVAPCTPLASLYTDTTLATPAPNPLTSDGLGNFHFYAAPGVYTLQIYGPGINTYTTPDVILPVNPSDAQFSSITATNAISALTLSLGGNLSVGGNANVTGTLTAGSFNANFSPSSNAQTKGYGGVLYVDTTAGACGGPGCSDANDGKSIGSAMSTVDHAACSLPGGNCAASIAGSGVIYFVNNSAASATPGCGFWIMGSNDPNYASPPACWLKEVSGTSGIELIGLPYQTHGPNGKRPTAILTGGSSADRNHPLIWVSGTNGSYDFENIAGQYTFQRGVVVGECSNNTRTNTCNVSGINFYNDFISVNTTAGYGPSWDITGGSFWITIRDSGGQGTDTVNPPTGDLAPAMLVDGRTNGGVGLLTIDGFDTSEGGIKIYPGSGLGADVNISNVTSEAIGTHGAGEATVWFAYPSGGCVSCIINATLTDIQTADATGTIPAVQNDMQSGAAIKASHIYGQGLNTKGPMVVTDQDNINMQTQTVSPLAYGQQGFSNGWVIGKRDDVQWQGGLTHVQYANLVAGSNCSTWNFFLASGTCGVTDPFGGTNAGSQVGAASASIRFTPGSSGVDAVNLSVGDVLVGGAWTKSVTGNGYAGNPFTPLFIITSGAGFTFSCNQDGNPVGGSTEWIWSRVLCTVTAVGTNPDYIVFGANSDATHTVAAYGPVLNYIPSGSVPTNQIYEYYNSFKTYDKLCSVGTLCGLQFSPPTFFAPIIDSASGASGLTFRNSGSTVWTADASASALSFNFNAHLGETTLKLAPFGGQSYAGLVDNYGMTAGFVSVTETSGTASFDAGLGNTFELTLNANATSTTLSNAQPGQWLSFIVCQPASGGPFTFAWPSNVHGGMTIGTTAGKCSAQSFAFDGTSAFATSPGVANQ